MLDRPTITMTAIADRATSVTQELTSNQHYTLVNALKLASVECTKSLEILGGRGEDMPSLILLLERSITEYNELGALIEQADYVRLVADPD